MPEGSAQTTQPRAVFRTVAVEGTRHLVVDVTVDPVDVICEVHRLDAAWALSMLLGRHADEFCDLLAEIRGREPF